MKKNTFLFVSLLCVATTLFSQRISELTIEGETALTPFGAFNPKNNGGRTGIGEIVYNSTIDLTNVNVTLNVGTASAVTAPDPWPTDWTSTVSGVKVSSTESTDWADYNITIKKINPTTLPFVLNTGADGDFNSNDWTSETVGWAAAAIDKGKNVIRFGSANRSFVVAFNESPDKIKFTMKSLGDWHNEIENVFDVEASSDGLNWTTVIKYNKTELMPPASPAVEREFQLAPEDRFVRWIYSVRDKASGGGFNVLLENIAVTKLTSSVNQLICDNVGAAFLPNTNILTFKDNSNVQSITLYSVSGIKVYESTEPKESMTVPGLVDGVYLLKLKLKDGVTATDKLLKK